MNFIYRLFLAINSTYLIIVVYLVKKDYYFNFLENYAHYFSWLIFILTPIVLTAISFLVLKFLSSDSLNKKSVVEVELANNSFLPTYLGYFFVSLSIDNIPTLCIVFIIIYVFTFLSQTLYFNPIFLLFNYNFYFIKTTNNVRIFLITKKLLRKPGEDDFEKLKRINNYTFIDIEKIKK